MANPIPMAKKPDREVAAKGKRRRFTAEYKRRILAEADKCKRPGEVGALLRREGLYSSHLRMWRAAREAGDLAGPTKKRGPTAKPVDENTKRVAELERENAKLRARAERAEFMVEMQKSCTLRSAAGRGERAEVTAIVQRAASPVGIRAACRALGVDRASYVLRRGPT